MKAKKACHRTWAAGGKPVKGGHTGDIMTPEVRSLLMARIKGKNTNPELLLNKELRKLGFRFTCHAKDLPGRPDFVLRHLRVAIFVDGDFWHGWRFPLWQHKLSTKWREKITANRSRDQRNFRRLRRDGWLVIRIWEHQIERSAEQSATRVAARIERFNCQESAIATI